jgi:SAM-dependent methyltransferase
MAREIAREHLAAGDPFGWFEVLYSSAGRNASIIPWADLSPNPNVVAWVDAHEPNGSGRSALSIGCGLGDDAEELAVRGFATTAFDISESAIAWCRSRFASSPVTYVVADLLQPPAQWDGKFDLVLESYTLQVLPPNLRGEAIRRVAAFVAPRGTLLVVARGREPSDPEGEMPWPLTRDEVRAFQDCGLRELSFEDYMDGEDPPVRRFRGAYRAAG